MSNTAHTPTPWVWIEKPTTAGTVFKVGSQAMVDGTHGCICLYDDHTSLNPHPRGTQAANAALIVRACNSHEQLVAALQVTTNDLAVQIESEGKDPAADSRIKRARAALAAAEAA
jgi:hypothetical protein